MNWIKENKFLTGLLAVLVIGIGVLGWLIMGASGRLEEATAAYEAKASERARLHKLAPYPSAANVKELEGQKGTAQQKIIDLQRSLAATELPIEPLTPAQFQDKLRLAVTDVQTLAGTHTKLGDKFFLGFDKYETSTPDPAAAALLGRQLKAIQWLVTRFIDAKAVEIRDLQREPLPEESGKARSAVEEKPAAKGAKAEKPTVPLVQPHEISLTVRGEPGALRSVLNQIVSSKEQFFIPRVVSFKNEKEKLPRTDAKTGGGAAVGAEPAEDGSAPPVPVAAPSTYIVGEERVDLTLRLEMIDFTEPPAK